MKKPLKVLFIQSSGLSIDDDGQRMGVWAKNRPVEIETSFIKTRNNTVDAVTEHVVSGDFDAVVIDECHGFDKSDATENNPRAAAYEQLGLAQEKKPWQDHDPNYPLSGVALVQYLRSAFTQAGQPQPKFGYIDMCGKETFEDKFEILGIEDNADFYLSTGFEGPEEHIQKIYQALSVS